MKPATGRARKLLAKLTALAERGINGEKANAIKKLVRLRLRFDFSQPDNSEAKLFDGVFIRGFASVPVHQFTEEQMPWAGNVKWAIETATRIPCSFRGAELMAEARPETAEKLGAIAKTIGDGFGSLWEQYSRAPGVCPSDRSIFFYGLYDGMMNETRPAGVALPSRPTITRVPKAKRRALAAPAGITAHPYTIGARLGGRIRGAVPLAGIARELDSLIKGEIADTPNTAV